LVLTLSQAKLAPIFFTLIEKGAAEGKLLLAAKHPIPAKEVNEARTELSGGAVFSGRCSWDGEQYVFETPKEPPSMLAHALKTIIHRDAGLVVKLDVRLAPDLAAEQTGVPAAGVPGEPVVEVRPSRPPQAAGQASPDGATQFTARLKALLPEIQQAEAGTSPVSHEIKLRMGEADVFARKHDFTQANVLLDQIESLVRQVPAGPPPSPPPDAAKAAVMKRLGALAEPIKAALAGPNKARVHEFVLQIEGLIKGNEFVKAGKVLDELEPLVKRGQVEGATATTAKGKFVLMQQARLAWNRIRDDVMAELVSIEQEIIQKCAASNNDPDEEFEVDLEEVKTGTKTLYKLINQLNTDLLDQLDETLNKYSDENQRAEGYKVAAQLVTDFKNTLSADPLLNRVDNNGFKQTKIRATVVGILDYLISKLA
jgi:hypothetical protein